MVQAYMMTHSPDTLHATTASADYYRLRPPHPCLTVRPCRVSVCGARHLQHNAHQSEPTLPLPKRLPAAQPPCIPTRSHPSPLRVHCRLLRSAVRGSCTHNLLVHLPSRHTSTATGYWRVCGFARDGTETLAFQPHTHTHIIKPPRAQHARGHNKAHQLPWRSSLHSTMRVSRHTLPEPVTPCVQQQASTTATATQPITRNRHLRQARLDSSSIN